VVTIEDVTTTTYTFVTADAGKIKRFTNASGCSATVNTGTFSQGDSVGVQQGNSAGQITVVAGSGVTVKTTKTLKTNGAGALTGLVCQTTSTGFIFVGDRAAT
jgi:hypothetical protein